MSDLPDYAINLRRLQDASGRTQAENARRAGLERDAYGRYLHGKTRPPAAKLAALALAFGVAPEDIDPEQTGITIDDADLPPPFEIQEARTSGPGYLRVKIDADLPADIAGQIVELAAFSAPKRR
ncbi:hypothetical protein PARHAE_03245 [Paracoccus haematequi]|uniref:HTH cro/C1-type domain-containing protein n=1 Tax=Paracoccus haematequi TaxID=2491866 RepID=A0A3S4GSQ1_9RHOB|nr:helix-turn-helix transcriptional regulator [Paracoccus haematequi]VDS10034.1 hypothetical protein PARHAE_03245 [Paracoccus haematequi]